MGDNTATMASLIFIIIVSILVFFTLLVFILELKWVINNQDTKFVWYKIVLGLFFCWPLLIVYVIQVNSNKNNKTFKEELNKSYDANKQNKDIEELKNKIKELESKK